MPCDQIKLSYFMYEAHALWAIQPFPLFLGFGDSKIIKEMDGLKIIWSARDQKSKIGHTS